MCGTNHVPTDPTDTMKLVTQRAEEILAVGKADWEELQSEGQEAAQPFMPPDGVDCWVQVWGDIRSKQEIWDLLEKSKNTFSQVKLEPGQSLMQNKLVKQVRASHAHIVIW